MAIESAVLPLMRWRDRDIYFAGDRYHEGFGVVAFRAFESARIKTWTFRLDEPQGHHCSAFWASRALRPVREHCLSLLGLAQRFSRVEAHELIEPLCANPVFGR